MALQSTYLDNIRPAVAGQQGDMQPATMVSRTVMNSAGVAFGKAVAPDTAGDYCVHAFTTGDTEVFGFAIRERSLVAEGNKFNQYDSVRVMRMGNFWGQPAQDVTKGNPVYVRPSNGDLQKDNTNSAVLVPGARWDMTVTLASGDLALISITPIK